MRNRRKPILGGRESPAARAIQGQVDEKRRCAEQIVDSQSFCEIMKGSCHQELHVHALQDLWREYRSLGGGYDCKEP